MIEDRRRSSVLVVSPALLGHGGMSSVARSLVTENPLLGAYRLSHRSTHPGVGERSASSALVSLVMTTGVCFRLLVTPPDVVHLMVGPRLSLVRKLAVAATARLRGSAVLLHVHSGAVDRAFMGERVRGVPQVLLKALVALSDGVAFLWTDPLRNFCAAYPHRLAFLVPNQIEEPPCCEPEPMQRTDIAFVGRVVAEKGAAFLLDLINHSRLAHPEWTWTIAGEPGDDVGRRVWDALSGTPGVKLLGWISEGDVEGLLRSARVLVLPTAFESLPMSVLLAAVCDCAIVATPAGSLPQLLADERGALLDLDVDEWEQAISRILESPRQASPTRLHEHVTEHYSPERVASDLSGAYAAVLSYRFRPVS